MDEKEGKIEFLNEEQIKEIERADKKKNEELVKLAIKSNKGKTISLVVALIYLLISISGGGEAFLLTLAFLILPLGLIWFGDSAGGYIGMVKGPIMVNQTTPGGVLRFIGWVILFLPIIIPIIYLVLGIK